MTPNPLAQKPYPQSRLKTGGFLPSHLTRRVASTFALTVLAGVAALIPARSGAQSAWIGGTSTDWSDASNWSNGVPAGIDAIINVASGNIATVSTDVTATQPVTLRLGDGGVGTMNVQAGGNIVVSGETWIGNLSSGIGTNNISGGTYTGNSWFAVGRGGSKGTLNLTGGTLAVSGNPIGVGLDAGTVGVFNQSGGTATSAADLWVGNNDQGGGQNSATYNLSGGSMAVNSWLVVGRHNTVGILNISGGSLTKTSDNGNQFLIGVDTGSSLGIINQTGGAITNILSDTYLAAYNHGTGVWNLNGGLAVLSLLLICHDNNSDSIGTMNLNTNGTLIVSQISGNASVASSTFNFNGGTLIASGPNAGFMSGLTVANVRNGGAIIDDGGAAITIAQPLVHSTINGDNATDGGLTKNGTGTLELSGINNYNGDTIVNAGTLQLDVTGSSFGSFRVTDGAALNLNFSGSYVVAGFYTNGVALPVGTYNAGNLPAFIAGTGNLQVAASISTGVWTGDGADNNWSTAGNWDQNAEPVFPIGLTFAGSTRLTNNNDLTGITASSLTFDAAAGAFVLGGNDLTLSGNLGFNGNPATPVTQTINLNLTWYADKTIDTPANGNLALGGNVTATTNNLSKIDAGTLTLGGVDAFGGFNGNGGTVTITGTTTVNGTGGNTVYLGNGDAISNSIGRLMIQPGASLNVIGSYGDDMVFGRDGGSGTVVQNGGTFSFQSALTNLWIGASGQPGTSSEYDMNGGLWDMNANNIGLAGSANNVTLTGRIIQTGGVITNVNQMNLSVLFNGSSGGNSSSSYTLSGGSLYFIGSHGFTAGSQSYSVNLGGGIVGAEASWSSSVNMNLTSSNGAVTFDTAGNTIALSGMLSGNGGLTEIGGGILELSGANTYAGDTTVNAGVLQLDTPGSSQGAFRLIDGTLLNLNNNGVQIVAAFYTNNVALPNGIYNAGNLPGFIAGSGSLQVAGTIFTNQPQNQLVYLNGNYHQSVTLTSGTTGAAATYQWYLNGNPVSGATNSNLTLSNLQINNGGNYYIVATSGSGSVTSSVVAVTIYAVNNNIFAYEGFDYTSPSYIDDGSHNGGFGWAGSWIGVDGGSGNSYVVSPGLAGGNHVPNGYDARSVGNSLFNSGASRVGRFFDTSTNSELFKQGFIDANGNIGANGKTIYLSFLQSPNTTGIYYELGLKRGNLSDPGRVAGIGNDGGSGNNDANFRIANSFYDLGPGDANVVDLYVVRIDFKAGSDDVFIYRNPSSITPPATPTMTVSNAADMSLNGLSVDAFVGTTTVSVDEIRLGATWADAIGLAVSNLLPPSKVVNGLKVSFAATPGYTYRIQRTSDLTGTWTDLTTVTAPENGYIEYTDTAAPTGQSFYRTVTP